MNGRIYDAKLGRFLQADPFIQAPLDTQMLNRYSYTRNNPLNATDPSGYFLKDLFKAIFDIIGVVVSIAAGAVCAAAGGPAAGFACVSLVQSAFLFLSDAIFGGNSSKGFVRGSFSSSASPSGFGGGGGRAAGGICTPENGCILNLSGVDADDSPSTFDGQSIVASRLFTYGSLPGSNTEKEVSKIVGQVSASGSTAITGEKFANGAVTNTYYFALSPPTADEGIHTDVLFYNLSLKPAEAAAILATTGLATTGLDVAQQQGKPSVGEAFKYKGAFSPGIGAKVKLFGLEVTALNINAAEGVEGDFSGKYNPFIEGNLTLLKIKLGKYAFNLGASAHADLTGDGNSQFEFGDKFGFSKSNTSTNFSTIGITINPVLFKIGGSVDFGTLFDSFSDE